MVPTILVTDWDFPDLSIERTVLDGTDVEVMGAQAKTPEAVIDAAADVNADGLLVQYASITQPVFEALDLRAVGRYGIGVDSVDLNAATDHDVQVVNVPGYCTEEVSTHALALLLSCVRHTVQYDHEIKDGTWDWTTGKPIERIVGSTLGLVGFGTIPQRLVELVEGFDFDIVVYDPYVDADTIETTGCENVGFEELLERARFVSLHTPLTEDTREMFDEVAFDAMREDAVLVNTARGGLIDTDALRDAIETDAIAGAGIDVLPTEPPNPTPPFDHPHVVYTPHVAWYSESSIMQMRRTLSQDVLGIIRGNAPMNPANSLH